MPALASQEIATNRSGENHATVAKLKDVLRFRSNSITNYDRDGAREGAYSLLNEALSFACEVWIGGLEALHCRIDTLMHVLLDGVVLEDLIGLHRKRTIREGR